MAWFAQQIGAATPAAAQRELGRYLRAAGVVRTVDALCGPFGVRRFVLRFRARGGSVRVESIEAVPLQHGGGPPPQDPRGQRMAALERALTALHRNMSTGPAWDHGAIGVLRDAQGRSELIPTFQDDADVVILDNLPVPGPPGHPLESRHYLYELERHAVDIQQVLQQTHAQAMDWDTWEVTDEGMLVAHWQPEPEAPPTRTLRARCIVLGTYQPHHARWTWQTPQPLFEGPVCSTPQFPATLDAAMELGLLMTAKVGGRWLFSGTYDDHGSQLLVAVQR